MQYPQLLLSLVLSASGHGIGQQPPIDPTNGMLRCTLASPSPPRQPEYHKALDSLINSAATAPFLGDSGITTRRRCYQKEVKGSPGCTVLASHDDAKIAVCGGAFSSMLCQDVADVVQKILNECPDDAGGELVVVGEDAFLVKVYSEL